MSRRVFADFDAELLLRISNRDDVTPGMRAQFINDAYLMIANEFVHPELQGTAIELVGLGSPDLVPTAGDIWWPMFMQDVKHSRAIDYSSYVKIEATGKVLGDLTEYYWWGNRFSFNRLANDNIPVKIWYQKTVKELTADSAPVFNRIFDVLVPMRAAKLALETVGNQEMAHIQETEFRNYAATMKLPVYEHERNDRRKGVRVRMR
jgi:hypothetical protein